MARLLLIFLLIGLIGCEKESDQDTSLPDKPEKRLTIGIVPRASSAPWQALRRAAGRTAAMMDVRLSWQPPVRDDDGGAQLRAVDELIEQRVDAIAIAPADPRRMRSSLAEAAVKAPLMLFSSTDDIENASGFIYSSATRIGQIAADHTAELLGGAGNVVLVRVQDPLATQYECEEAFKTAILGKEKLELIAEPTVPDDPAAIDDAIRKMLSQPHRINAIFATNERATLAVLGALQATHWDGQIKLIGLGYDPRLLAEIETGAVAALLVDDMPKIGETLVKLGVARIRGTSAERFQTIDPLVVTAKTRKTPEIQSILKATP